MLVEGPSKNAYKHPTTGPVQLTGRTPTDHIVVFDGNERLAGQTVQVDVHEASPFTLFGTVVTGEQVGVECCGPEPVGRAAADWVAVGVILETVWRRALFTFMPAHRGKGRNAISSAAGLNVNKTRRHTTTYATRTPPLLP